MTERTLPGKSAEAYRTIGEAAEELKLPQHVLRFWETRFPQVKPLKRAGGRRFYRPEDVALLGAIKALLYGEGYTIKGVQRLLQDQGPRAVAAAGAMAARVASGTRRGQIPAERPEGLGTMRDDDDAKLVASASPPSRPFAAGLPSPPVSPPQFAEQGSVAPASTPRETSINASAMVARLEAIAFELGECERLLVAARAPRS